MKRLVSVLLLMLCLSFPVLGGHTLPGNWCECGSFYACICDDGELPRTASLPAESKPIDLGSGTLLVLTVLLLALRYKP